MEETQLVFRGGGGGANRDKKIISNTSSNPPPIRLFAEGSIDRVTLIDEETFVTGSDNGSLSLWTLHKKKPIFTLPLAHGLDPPLTPEEISSEQSPDPNFISEPQARWITALTTVPYSDLILSGSWDGWVRLWRVSEDKKRIEKVGVLGRERGRKDVPGDAAGEENGDEGEGANEQGMVKGVINDLAVVERGERGQDGVCVVVARGTEHRLGRWKIIKGAGNGAMVFEVPKLRAENRVGPSSSNRR